MKRDSVSLLRTHGLHVTAQRLAVLEAVSRRPHATADEIARLVRARIGTVSRQAVYDALSMLTERGLLRRIQPARSPARYEDRTGDNHHHLICRRCGHVEDVDCAVGAAPCLVPSDGAGYEIDEAEVIYWGLCPDCLARTTHAARTRDDRASTSPAPGNVRAAEPGERRPPTNPRDNKE